MMSHLNLSLFDLVFIIFMQALFFVLLVVVRFLRILFVGLGLFSLAFVGPLSQPSGNPFLVLFLVGDVELEETRKNMLYRRHRLSGSF